MKWPSPPRADSDEHSSISSVEILLPKIHCRWKVLRNLSMQTVTSKVGVLNPSLRSYDGHLGFNEMAISPHI